MSSSKHLAKGDPLPDLPKGKITLFSMLFCPYAQRIRLILNFKNIDYNVVNINLRNKPDWLTSLNPNGQVPILYEDGTVIHGSLQICEYLNEKYPEPPLFNKYDSIEDEKNLVKSIDPLITLYYNAVWKKDNKTFQEHINAMKPYLENLESVLRKRGKYFGGDQPKFSDFMIWPWAERSEVLSLTFKENLPYSEFPIMEKWCKNMRIVENVAQILIEPSRHFKATQFHLGAEPLYDEI